METIVYLIIALLAFNYAESQEHTPFYKTISGLSLGLIIVISFKILIAITILLLATIKVIL